MTEAQAGPEGTGPGETGLGSSGMGSGEPSVAIRLLEGMEDWRRAADFQELIWGPGFPEKAPPSLMMVSARLGGVVAAAFRPDGEMVGFVFGITGVEDGRPVHWSDMLGVSPAVRDRGLGTRLKRFQREQVLKRGVSLMYWSQDPLESRNGRLNLHRLGAVAVEYVPDMYGEPTSPLHRGLGTDRFVVRWELDSELARVRAGPDGTAGTDGPAPGDSRLLAPAAALPSLVSWQDAGGAVRPVGPDDWPESVDEVATHLARYRDGFRVAVPARIQELKATDPDAAAAWRRATRAVLHPALAAGWTVTDLVRAGPVSEYVVRPPAPDD